ncbi:UNKNOWN [Stylonychia lemnae]|uniref:Transmembrane protein n=1 Tax=Stylonychia lemnae TaxID=5949 RepID=A0A077ZTA2_STYLE|nr:UNKNOWN [Stylonychia lemnae]|eukprot:CDW73112.1 UNKNOWN [Stylonychia lemnae]
MPQVSKVLEAVIPCFLLLVFFLLLYVLLDRCQKRTKQFEDLVYNKGTGRIILPGIKFNCNLYGDSFSIMLKDIALVKSSIRDQQSESQNLENHSWLEQSILTQNPQGLQKRDLENIEVAFEADVDFQKIQISHSERSHEFNDDINESIDHERKSKIIKYIRSKIMQFDENQNELEEDDIENQVLNGSQAQVLNVSQWSNSDIRLCNPNKDIQLDLRKYEHNYELKQSTDDCSDSQVLQPLNSYQNPIIVVDDLVFKDNDENQ